jgi:hypothetical protein
MVHYRYLHNGLQSYISDDIFPSVFEEYGWLIQCGSENQTLYLNHSSIKL